MQQSFTHNQIVQYLYGEMPAEESISLMEWILSDEEAHSQFDELAASKNMLDSTSFSPAPSSVNRLISYGHRLTLEEMNL